EAGALLMLEVVGEVTRSARRQPDLLAHFLNQVGVEFEVMDGAVLAPLTLHREPGAVEAVPFHGVDQPVPGAVDLPEGADDLGLQGLDAGFEENIAPQYRQARAPVLLQILDQAQQGLAQVQTLQALLVAGESLLNSWADIGVHRLMLM